MSIEVKVPQLPESVTDATLVAWHKKAGDKVGRDENLVDLETDKVMLEVPAPLPAHALRTGADSPSTAAPATDDESGTRRPDSAALPDTTRSRARSSTCA